MSKKSDAKANSSSDLAIVSAVWIAHKDRNFEPLIRLINEGNKGVLDESLARDILIDGLKHLPTKKRGGQIDKKKQAKNEHLATIAYYYHGLGLPKWNDASIAKTESACTRVAREYEGVYHSVSESTIKAAMKKYKNHSMSIFAFEAGKAESENSK